MEEDLDAFTMLCEFGFGQHWAIVHWHKYGADSALLLTLRDSSFSTTTRDVAEYVMLRTLPWPSGVVQQEQRTRRLKELVSQIKLLGDSIVQEALKKYESIPYVA